MVDEDPESFYIILTHEMIHLAIDEIGKGCCPYWLYEGSEADYMKAVIGECLTEHSR